MKALMQISKISLLQTDYPEYLGQIDAPPKDLYIRGTLPTEPMIAVIGTRRPSQYGRDGTYRLAADLGAGASQWPGPGAGGVPVGAVFSNHHQPQ